MVFLSSYCFLGAPREAEKPETLWLFFCFTGRAALGSASLRFFGRKERAAKRTTPSHPLPKYPCFGFMIYSASKFIE